MPTPAHRRPVSKSLRRRAALAAAVAGGVAVAWAALPPRPAGAAEGLVVGTDGRTFSGDVTERGDEVEVVRGGISTTLPRSSVQSVEYGTFAERFDRQIDELAADDVRGRVALARQALDERDYDRAETALLQAQSIDGQNAEVGALLSAVRTQRRLPTGAPSQRPRPEQPAAPDGPANDGAADDGRARYAPPERNYLTPEQINRIKQAELRPEDRAARVRFEGDVAREYVERNALNFGEFRRKSLAAQATEILAVADDDARKQVIINNDPEPLATYRRQVQPLILSGCATSRCHGGNAGGNFILFDEPSEEAAYTNFYILTQYSAQVGTEGGGIFSGPAQRGMVERGQADSSLLLNYALPPKTAAQPHPQVAGYNGVYQKATDPGYRTIADWMNTTLINVQPDYGIDYTPPGQQAEGDDSSTQPAE